MDTYRRQLARHAHRRGASPRINARELVEITVSGEIAHPSSKRNPYRIGRDGVPRVVPGAGGIVVNQRVGDPCIGLAADHVEPGVSIRNPEVGNKPKDGPNLALNTYACVGNLAVVVSGPCEGKRGMVFGKHGGVNHVLVDFPSSVLRRLRNGDRIQVCAIGQGLRLPDHPMITAWNCSPRLMRRWALRSMRGRLLAPVTHRFPATLMGSGLGRNNAVRGDYDIQLADRRLTRRFRLDRLRYGDFVAIDGADTRYGRSHDPGFVTVGIVVHSDSTVSGHGPGVVTLLTGPTTELIPIKDPMANFAAVFELRDIARPAPRRTLVDKDKSATPRRAHTDA